MHMIATIYMIADVNQVYTGILFIFYFSIVNIKPFDKDLEIRT